MTTIKIKVDNKHNARILQKMLQAMSFVKEIESDLHVNEKQGQYGHLKKLLSSIEPGSLFSDIENPVKWQKEIRDEWNAY